MRLLCNGVALDLMSGATISLKKVNPLFAFDSLQCERSQAFSIPDTPTNDRVLGIAKNPAYHGEGMRRRFDAELQDGAVVKLGHLYVDKFSNGKYSAVFVTGDLIRLQAMKDAGNISDFLVVSESGIWGNTITSHDAYITRPIWASVNYDQTYAGAIPYLSYNLTMILARCFQYFGISEPTYPNQNYIKGLRVVPAKMQRVDEKMVIKSEPVQNSRDWDIINRLDFPRRYFDVGTFDIEDGYDGFVDQFSGYDQYDRPVTVRHLSVDQSAEPEMKRRIQCLVARYDCKIHFDLNAPSNLRLFKRDIKAEIVDHGYQFGAGGTEYGYDIVGAGTYENDVAVWLERTGTTTIELRRMHRAGWSIAGKTFDLRAGEKFSFIDTSDLAVEYAWSGNVGERAFGAGIQFVYDGGKAYFTDGQKRYEVRMSVSTYEVIEGESVLLQPNLPKLKITDILKGIAAMTGTLLNYDPDRGITFETLDDFNAWPVLNISNAVIDYEKVDRTFSGYAQRNIVRYDDEEYVYTYEKADIEYTIDNENLSEEKDLQIVPFNSGGVSDKEYEEYIPFVLRNAESREGSKDTIGSTSPAEDDVYMGRVYLKKNAGVQALCDASTSVSAHVRMTMADFDTMKAKTSILMNGTRYVWTEATWSKEVATLKLSKIL